MGYNYSMAKHNETGELGEREAARYLEERGYRVIDRNYRKKWGELDIVAEKKGRIYFVEVKTVSHRYTGRDKFKPEDNMHPWKMQRLGRAIQTYLMEKFKKGEPDWQLDLACVYIDSMSGESKVEYIEDIVL